jgi:peptidylprolyl isomerase
MNSKQTNIVILLVIIAIALFVVLEFFGLGNLFGSSAPAPKPTGAETLLQEIQKSGSVTDLRIESLVQGSGDGAVSGDTVTVNYKGLLTDGTVFDASEKHGQPFSFTLGTNQVIQGWEQGILGMKKGESRLLAIPPALGYAGNAVGSIPPNSTLIFEVEMLNIEHSAPGMTP